MDPGSIITEEIERKEGREVTGRMLPVQKRLHLQYLLGAARGAIGSAERGARDMDADLDKLTHLVDLAAEALLKASECLEEQALLVGQAKKLRGE